MKKIILRRILLSSAVVFSIYFVFVLWFAFSTYHLANSAKQTYEKYQQSGYTSEFKDQYIDLLSKINRTYLIADSPLIKPIINLTPYKDDFYAASSLYLYLKTAMPALPRLLGGEQPQKYLVAFQNSAEARGTGGIIGAFAILEINRGKSSIEKVGSNAILQSAKELPINLPKQFSEIYRSDPAIWQNSNMSPHFPYGAKIWLALWKKQFSQELDGVITLDPIVLSSILKITGPIKVENKVINGNNVVKETLSDAYLKYEKDNIARKLYLVSIIDGVAKAILNGNWTYHGLLKELKSPILDQRILVFNKDPRIENILLNSKISGNLELNATNNYRLVIQNTAGNKMDYYLDRSVIIANKSCEPSGHTLVKVTLKNAAGKDNYLPDYVKGRLDLGLPSGRDNSTAITAFIYGPINRKILYASEKGKTESFGFIKTELNRQAYVIPIELNAGQSKTFEVTFENGKGPISTNIQPLVRNQKTRIMDKCA